MISIRPRVALALLAALLTLAFPATASAAFTVNSTADEPDAAAGAPCETAAGKCTLRAAIQLTNEAGIADNILFDAALFDGQLADTIALGSPLPAIKAPVSINAGSCAPLPNPKPCAGVSGPSGNFGISVEADGVTISGLAVTGALTGINVINASEDFTARGNWIGVKLDGDAGANNTGIFIDPGSDGATIGGLEAVQRNVIAGNNNEGLDIQGASDAVIRGNYFGVAPDGATEMGNAKNIEITDSTSGGGDPAENNEVGTTLEGAALSSSACDGGCNVIAGATGTGLDLDGQGGGNEAPATGPTTVHGNYVGLRANGLAAVPNGFFAILAGAADDATIGGLESGDFNRITGSGFGVYGEDGDDLSVLGNVIGVDAGAGLASPPATGIFVHSESISGPEARARIAFNSIFPAGRGIEQRFSGAEITDNFVLGGNTGIYTAGPSLGEGSLIESNRVREASGNGILIENDSNVVIDNEVKEAGEAGILVKYAGLLPAISPSTGNVIGGDDEIEENELLLNGGPAIEIKDLEATNNEVARNHGEGNSGLFIDLVSAQLSEPNGPNEGIKPPAIAAAFASSISGTALPGATVRVFRKAGAEPGELESFLGETEADGSGNWKVGYQAAIPVGTIVAATQTNANGGTSELATATAEPDPKPIVVVDGGCAFLGNCPKPQDKGKSETKDTVAPRTSITKAPQAKSSSTTAKFRFKSNEAGSKFQCKLDKGKFRNCKSPKTYKRLKPGKHVFKVRAVDKAGNVGKPAKRKFTVLAS